MTDRLTARIKAQQRAAGMGKPVSTIEIKRTTLLLLYRARRGINAQIRQLRSELKA